MEQEADKLIGSKFIDRWIPLKKAVTRIFNVFFDLRLNKQLSKQLRRRWFGGAIVLIVTSL